GVLVGQPGALGVHGVPGVVEELEQDGTFVEGGRHVVDPRTGRKSRGHDSSSGCRGATRDYLEVTGGAGNRGNIARLLSSSSRPASIADRVRAGAPRLPAGRRGRSAPGPAPARRYAGVPALRRSGPAGRSRRRP